MNNKYILQQQEKIISFLKKAGGDRPLNVLCEDSCSELCRLLSCWIIKDYPEANITILKGDGGFNTEQSHEIVLMEQDETRLLIDPSVWQFFEDKKGIVVGKVENVGGALVLAHDTYGGEWKISEKIDKNICDESDELERIIIANAQEPLF